MLRFLMTAFLLLAAGLLLAGCAQQTATLPPAPPTPPSATPARVSTKARPLDGVRVLFVIAPKDFKDVELATPLQLLADQGADVTITSKRTDPATGMDGAKVTPDLALSEVRVPDYDAVVFVGGSGAPVYFDDAEALAVACEAAEEDKVVAAICLAPGILAKAGLLKGEDATITASRSDLLTDAGANYTGPGVVESGLFVTASGPDQAEPFAEKLAELLSHPEG